MRKFKFVPGEIYHVYNRGNNGRTIFLEERDRWRFLQSLALFNWREYSFRALWDLENKGEGANMRTVKKR